MKKLITLLICSVLTLASYAQADWGKNIVKLNLFSLPLKNINVEYERAITEKISVGLGIRYMNKGSLPFASQISKAVGEGDSEGWDERLKTANLGNFAITPTVRLYMGEGALKGFYIAAFARYALYQASLNYAFTVDNGVTSRTEDMPLSGDLKTFTGGILFGAQFNLSKSISLDWWIFGPHYGSSNGTVSGKRQLNKDEQDSLRDQLSEVNDLPVIKTTSTVDTNGATVTVKGPWAGIRAGLSLGYRF